MTFYSDSNVSTKYLDPKIYTPNARATFELDASEAAYLPNLRLTFLGVVASGAIGSKTVVDLDLLLMAPQTQSRRWHLHLEQTPQSEQLIVPL